MNGHVNSYRFEHRIPQRLSHLRLESEFTHWECSCLALLLGGLHGFLQTRYTFQMMQGNLGIPQHNDTTYVDAPA